MRILLAEDDQQIAEDIANTLRTGGYIVEHATEGKEILFLGNTENFDAIILDLGLPKLDGLTILKRWRQSKRNMPVLILTARGIWSDRVEGIDAGADDYLVKPFEMAELLARLRAVIRRSTGKADAILMIGELQLDTRLMQVRQRGVPLSLTPNEYRLLSYLMHHAGRVVSQSELTEHIYHQDFERDSNAIEVMVGRLRRKVGNDLIQTRRGFGYFIPDTKPDDIQG